MNQGVHTVDLLVAALGRPVEVFAYTGTLAHERIEAEDVAVGVVRFASGALGVLHATTAAYPGLSARLQVHGDRGSVVIENDQFAFFHLTPAGTEPEEKLMGSGKDESGRAYRVRSAARHGRADPGQLSDAHRLQYLNFLAALDGSRGPGRTWREPAVDQRHHRRVRVGSHRTAGAPVVSRVAANPIPYWAAGRQDAGGVRRGVPRLPGDRLHRGQGGGGRPHVLGPRGIVPVLHGRRHDPGRRRGHERLGEWRACDEGALRVDLARVAVATSPMAAGALIRLTLMRWARGNASSMKSG